MTTTTIDLARELRRITEHWSPATIAEVNEHQVKLAKLKGEFIWHTHEEEDELFLVLEGSLKIEMRDHSVTLEKGQIFVVPRGVEHRPIAEDEVHIMLFEPASTKQKGD
ncbi:MAG: cupin domain-containing protein [Planctomycetota bacterium]|jgi:mannose-6-phosphate isomerase-like protein (cupin superfamily)